MDVSIDVGSLEVAGVLLWSDATQLSPHLHLCAGYISVSGAFTLDLSSSSISSTSSTKGGVIYIKANGFSHPILGTRVLGAHKPFDDPTADRTADPTEASAPALLDIKGKPLARTWSLLASPLAPGQSTLSLMHDVQDMGWSVGDRIQIATTTSNGSQGYAESFFIASIDGHAVTLNKAVTQEYMSEFKARNGIVGIKAAEVIHLSRNVIISGDDFDNVSCDPALTSDFTGDQISSEGCMCTSSRTTCTMGLHTIASSNSIYKIQNTRIEKCGQRGVAGKYCAHLHRLKECKECRISGNAFEYSMQRGLVIHGTHLSTTEHNVFTDVRGAAMYIEDGNELLNSLEYNVAICPWALGDPEKWGCTIPGTSNSQADTRLNQAGVWSLSPSNHMLGNRFSNSFNGMLYETNAFGGNGRQFSEGEVCTVHMPLGRIEGNTFHSHGRFGTYVLSSTWPHQHDFEELLAADGKLGSSAPTCTGWTADGNDRGSPATMRNNVDYYNTFVGQYDAGDIQYANHFSESNNCLIYWKVTKNFQDGCSAHMSGGYYSSGTMNLPDQGAIVIEDSVFENSVAFEANHHCNIGVTGMLCAPTYVFDNVLFKGSNFRFFWADDLTGDNMAEAGLFVLAPNYVGDSPFPGDMVGLASKVFESFLVDYDTDGTCSLTTESKFSQGVLCSKPMRMIKVWTFDLDKASAPRLKVSFYRNDVIQFSSSVKLYAIGGVQRKQGYRFPVILGDFSTERYELELEDGSGIPEDWVIEFSDPVFGNRYGEERISLTAKGRACGSSVSSQHDRKWVFSSSSEFMGDNARGRGACSSHADADIVDCNSVAKLELVSCESECNGGVGCGDNAYCACGTGQCKCEAGYSGSNCENDICGAVACGDHGQCAARYLGGLLEPTNKACVCDEGWIGSKCDKNPCAAIAADACGGAEKGSCVNVDEESWKCDCEDGYSGSRCENTCVGFCSGAFPHSCNKYGGNYVYCNGGGGCHYSDVAKDLGASWCMMVGEGGGDEGGGDGDGVTPAPTPTTIPVDDPSADEECSCAHICNGSINKNYLWCTDSGACSYEDAWNGQKGGEWCLFKGSDPSTTAPTIAPTTAPTKSEDVVPTDDDGGQDCECEGFCNGSIDKPFLWCHSNGACAYDGIFVQKSEGWCLFKGTDPSTKAPTTSTAAPSPTPSTAAPSPTPSTASPSPTPSTAAPSLTPSTAAPSWPPTTAPEVEGIEEMLKNPLVLAAGGGGVVLVLIGLVCCCCRRLSAKGGAAGQRQVKKPTHKLELV
jgi:hypothetical protein